MADATDGKAHVLTHVINAAGAVLPLQQGTSGGLKSEITSASVTLDVQQRTPSSVTYLMSSTGAVSVSPAFQPATINRAFQVVKTGGGDLTHLLQASLDPVASSTPADAVWVTLMTSTASEGTATTIPWKFIRSNISAVSGSARVVVYMCA